MRPSLRGVVWLAWGVVALLIAATTFLALRGEPQRMAGRQASPAPASLAPRPAGGGTTRPATAAAPREAKPPSFDIVSVDRDGQAVIAGRAMPGDRVRVLDGDTPIGEVTADPRGEWVLVPAAPIAPGDRQLAVEATSPVAGSGRGAARRSPDIVALSVVRPAAAPGAKSGMPGGTTAMAVLLPGEPGASARILQRPQDRSRAPGGSRTLSLETAEYGGPDQLVLSGNAEPGARLNIYAGGRLLGSAVADDAGKWMLRSGYREPAGGIELRLDQLAADGGIVRRVTAPFAVPAGDLPGRVADGDAETYVVTRGNNLWLIARRVYGRGMRFTAIYAANQEMIRDPDRIYPGQALRLPR